MFRAVDVDDPDGEDDGELSYEQFTRALEALNLKLTPAQLTALIDSLDQVRIRCALRLESGHWLGCIFPAV